MSGDVVHGSTGVTFEVQVDTTYLPVHLFVQRFLDEAKCSAYRTRSAVEVIRTPIRGEGGGPSDRFVTNAFVDPDDISSLRSVSVRVIASDAVAAQALAHELKAVVLSVLFPDKFLELIGHDLYRSETGLAVLAWITGNLGS